MSIDHKLDKIAEDISDIKITQAKHHVVLQDHIRRTEILEASIKPSRIIAMIAAIAAIIESIHLVFK